MYVKTTQKNAKCLRCGRSHKVENILNSGIVVKGINEAARQVQKKQHELALKDPEFNLNLSSESSFTVARNLKDDHEKNSLILKELDNKNDYSEKFKTLLKKLSTMYKKFPKFMIQIMAEDDRIPMAEINILINEFKKKGVLISLKNNYFALKS